MIKIFEGLHKVRKDGLIEAYLDTSGRNPIWTIGWGHTKTAKQGMVITMAQAIALKKQDLVEHENSVKKYIAVPLRQGQFDALVSLSYNLGSAKFGKSSVVKAVNKNDFETAKKEQLKWVRGEGNKVLDGLKARRSAEIALMNEQPIPRPLKPIAFYNPRQIQDTIKNPNTFWVRMRSAVGA
jgi:lysozyme